MKKMPSFDTVKVDTFALLSTWTKVSRVSDSRTVMNLILHERTEATLAVFFIVLLLLTPVFSVCICYHEPLFLSHSRYLFWFAGLYIAVTLIELKISVQTKLFHVFLYGQYQTWFKLWPIKSLLTHLLLVIVKTVLWRWFWWCFPFIKFSLQTFSSPSKEHGICPRLLGCE